jgi:spore coat protein YutH
LIEEIIFQNYGIKVEQEESGIRYPSFRSGGMLYSIIPLETIDSEELAERQKMSLHLINQGDRYVSEFVLANHGSYISEAEGQGFLLLVNQQLEKPRSYKIGRKLAKFHHRGRSMMEPMKICSRIGQWKGLWEARVDQLEKVWNQKLQATPINTFEKLFLDTFPYYMALGENAIQYLVDTELDGTPEAADGGTVCYERFTTHTWSGNHCIKNPFDWVFDHRSRDLAEWIRKHYFEHIYTHQPGIAEFMNDYQTYQPLTSFSARLLYARLLFPIHYFEAAEEYFSQAKEARQLELEEQVTTYIQASSQYEEWLSRFYDIAQIPAKRWQLPTLGWL